MPNLRRPRPALRACLALVFIATVLGGCFLPSAARRSGRLVSDGFDSNKHGTYAPLTGAGMLLYAPFDFAVHSLVPIDYDGYFLIDRTEPQQKWFRFYDGPMLELDQVAILCSRERATAVTTIRTSEHERATFARHEKWHYPQCIEVLPGTYELKIDFYSRENLRRDMTFATYSTESTSPATIIWSPGPGEIYQLTAVLGDVTPSPGEKYTGTTIKTLTRSKTNLGANEFTLDEGHWIAVVEPVPSFGVFASPVSEHREAWKRYELYRRNR